MKHGLVNKRRDKPLARLTGSAGDGLTE